MASSLSPVGMKAVLAQLVEQQDLSAEAMTTAMEAVMAGQATPAQIGAFLVGLRVKGESVVELTAAARVMRRLAHPVVVDARHLVDTCGTGGDGLQTFNISTAAAIVAAAGGACVAKHGNRAVSSRCGSADILEAAGVAIDLLPAEVAICLREINLGFLFAPKHHEAMRHAAEARRDLGLRTLFNMLGPLTNPARAPNQIIGVYDAQLLEPVAEVACNLGGEHVLVVHARDGLDELSVFAPTDVAELRDGKIELYTITPADLGLETPVATAALTATSPTESLQRIHAVLRGEAGPALNIVLANAAAALYAAGVATDLIAGVKIAHHAIAEGHARRKLDNLVEVSNRLVAQR